MLDKIGIGVVTYNRLKMLKKLIEGIKRTAGCEYDLLVADDGSTDGTQEWLKENKIPFISGSNRGIAGNKNRILYKFQHYEHVFVLEDDVNLLQPGWVQLYLHARLVTGLHHFVFCSSLKYGNRKASTEYPGVKLLHYHIFCNGGQCSQPYGPNSE